MKGRAPERTSSSYMKCLALSIAPRCAVGIVCPVASSVKIRTPPIDIPTSESSSQRLFTLPSLEPFLPTC